MTTRQRKLTPFIESLSRRILHDHRSAGPELPSLEQLAVRYRASYVSVWRAVQTLKSQGHVTVSAGRTARLVDSSGPPSDPLGKAARRAADFIRASITDGTFRTGTPLPKSQYFALNLGASPGTVRSALHACAEKKLVHRRGRIWYAGPPVSPHGGNTRPGISITDASPVVLLILTDFPHWRRSSEISTKRNRLLAFKQELERYGISLYPVFSGEDDIDRTRLAPSAYPVPVGLTAARRFAQELGSRYYGAWFAATPEQFHAQSMLCWIEALLAFRRPVFWHRKFDDRNEESMLLTARTTLKGRYRRFFECAGNEEAIADTAIELLASYGHERIGVLRPARDVFWIEERIKNLRSAAERRGVSVFVENDAIASNILTDRDFGTWRDLDEILGAVDRIVGESGPEADESVPGVQRSSLLSHKPPLWRLLKKQRISALVALNDYLALEHYGWLIRADYHIPRDLSIVSFDNRIETGINPITTIDFGYDIAGYRAAHMIIGDIPIKPDASNLLLSTPRLMNRGSVRRMQSGRTSAPRSPTQ